MPEVGGAFTKTVTIASSSFTTIFAPTGEEIKVTMAYSKSGGSLVNDRVGVAPALGTEDSEFSGTSTADLDVPALGGNATNSVVGLQPILMTDTQGLYLGNQSDRSTDVIVQGVRIS